MWLRCSSVGLGLAPGVLGFCDCVIWFISRPRLRRGGRSRSPAPTVQDFYIHQPYNHARSAIHLAQAKNHAANAAIHVRRTIHSGAQRRPPLPMDPLPQNPANLYVVNCGGLVYNKLDIVLWGNLPSWVQLSHFGKIFRSVAA